MEYNKTLRWLEPYGGWSENDTGLCNRIFHWEIAHEICKQNNYDFKIILQHLHWPELDLLYLPNTATFKFLEYEYGLYHEFKFQNLRFKTVFDLQNDDVRLASKIDRDKLDNMFKNNCFDLTQDNHWYSDFGYEELQNYTRKNVKWRPLTSITLRHHFIEDFLRRNTKDVIGIHIRRNSGVSIKEEDVLSLPEHIRKDFEELHTIKGAVNRGYKFFKDELYFKIIDRILEINPEQKFYISCDLPYEMFSYYKDKYQDKIITKEDFIPVVQDYLLSAGVDIRKLVRGQVISNIVDLFSLSFCKFLVRSHRSTWSEFAVYYRNQPWSYPTDDLENKLLKRLFGKEWDQPGSYEFKEELSHEFKNKTFIKDVQGMAVRETTNKLI